MTERSSVFDMIGPVMIGPSSSHTAGVVRIARTAVAVHGNIPESVEITFYNSFAQTYEGHGSDKAAIAGLLDFKTDDVRIKQSFELAEEAKMSYKFKSVGNASTMHPNTIKLVLTSDGNSTELIGESRGGGVIKIVEVNGFHSGFNGSLNTLIITAEDAKGSIAFIAGILSQDDCNIATMMVSRKGKKHLACQIIETDSPARDVTLTYLKGLTWIKEIVKISILD